MDIEGIFLVQKTGLDWSQIRTELEPLLELKEDREAMSRLKSLAKRSGVG